MKRYFVRIDGKQIGPLSPEEVVASGVRPSTYIWRKGLDGWIKAEEDADICREIRRKFSESALSTSPPVPNAETGSVGINDNGSGRLLRFPWLEGVEFNDEQEDIYVAPPSLIPLSIIVTLFCFFPTGLVALYYANISRKSWKKSKKEGLEADQRKMLMMKAHDAARKGKMLIGISAFMALIVMAFIMRYL